LENFVTSQIFFLFAYKWSGLGIFSDLQVLKGEVTAHDRVTLRVKVKVTKGQIPVSERCENCSLPKSVWEFWIFFADGERQMVE
jgi:hypothetical protein